VLSPLNTDEDADGTPANGSSPQGLETDCASQGLRIVKTIAGIAGRLADNRDLAASIQYALAEMGALVGAGRAYLFQFRDDGVHVDNTHEWCAEGVTPQIAALQGLVAADFPWFMDRLAVGELFAIDSVAALPAAATPEREVLLHQGIQSLLVMPMLAPGHLAGFLGFDNVHRPTDWSPASIELLPVAAQLIGHALERERSYRRLQLSLQRQKAILENIPDIAWLKDVNGRFVHVNEAFARSCRSIAGDIVGSTDLDIWPRELAERYRQDDAEVIRTRRRKVVEEPFADKDLGERITETVRTPILDDDGGVVGTTGIARDITARTEVERQVREREERYRRLVESLPGVAYRYSPQQGASYWSPQVEAILGFSPQDLTRNPFLWHDAIHPADLPMVDEAIAAFEIGVPIDLCYRIRDARGGWHWFQDRSIGRSDLDGGVVIEGIAFDVTAQRRAEQALRESEQRYRAVVEDVPVMICRFLPDGTLTFVNHAYCESFGRHSEDLVGSSFLAAIPEQDRDNVMSTIQSLTADAPARTQDHRAHTPDGGVRWQRWTHRALFHAEGHIVAYQALGEDITERKRTEALIEYQATFDELTDLPKRRLLRERLIQALAGCRRHGHMGALLFIDLDQFKHVNDSLGHSAGDVLLKDVASRLKQVLRTEDTLARQGGDEFLLLFPELCDDPGRAAQHAKAGAEKVQRVLSSPFLIENQELHIAASIGIAMFPLGDDGPDDTIRHADMAMYRAKEAGRNAIRFFRPSMQLAAEERLKLHNALRRAHAAGELRLYFQPQVDSRGDLIGAEALLRWQHPQRGLVGPDSFIAAAEESGQILTFGGWVLETAITQLRNWSDQMAATSFRNVSINVSPRQFRQSDFTLRIERILAETDADPSRITLELTEGSLIESLEDAVRKIMTLKKLGVRFSIDDFGMGYSSLAYLRHLPLDEIKIDRSFVRNIATDPADARLVETIVTLADQLDIKVVAEGVESEDQLEFLRARGCGVFQGFYFCPPQPLDELTRLLHNRTSFGDRL